jgi:hypothetical protein
MNVRRQMCGFDEFMTDAGDASRDRKLGMERYFAEAIAKAARENLPPKDRGTFVSTLRNLARANLEIGKFRRAA